MTRYDWKAIQEKIDLGLSYDDLFQVVGCARSSILRAIHKGKLRIKIPDHNPLRFDWISIQNDYDAGLSYKELSKKYGVSIPGISVARKRGDFSPKRIPIPFSTVRSPTSQSKWDWESIQKDYNDGFSYSDICKKYNISDGSLQHGVRTGKFFSRTKLEGIRLATKQGKNNKPLSQETKNKISVARIKYLLEHPEEVPWRKFHSSKESYPEKIFRQALESSNISGWIAEYQNGIYCYDFAFPDLKIDVEIDGGTHLTEKVLKIDARRDAWSREQGWKVIRFTADKVKNDIIRCIDELKSLL